MEIVKYKKKNANEYIITLSDNTSLSFYDDVIIYYNLLGKKNIDDKLLKEINEYNKNYEAYYKALNYIKAKLRTEKEIETKLKSYKYSNKNINFAMDKLKQQGYINNELYLKSYIADQINLSSKGPKKIIQELTKLDFNEDEIKIYLNEYEDEMWKEKIKKIINKRIKSNHNLSNVMFKNKIKKDLVNLGYELSFIDSFVNKITVDNTDILYKEFNKELNKLKRKYNGEELKYKLKYNLYKKGFNIDEILSLINEL